MVDSSEAVSAENTGGVKRYPTTTQGRKARSARSVGAFCPGPYCFVVKYGGFMWRNLAFDLSCSCIKTNLRAILLGFQKGHRLGGDHLSLVCQTSEYQLSPGILRFPDTAARYPPKLEPAQIVQFGNV